MEKATKPLVLDEKLLKKILWFNNKVKFDIDFFEFLQPQRTVSNESRYNSGVFYSEKCKREIQYESGIELDFIKQLEKSDKVLFYFEQPVQIPYWRSKRKHIYTPDFGVYLKSKHFVIVEIKDVSGMLEHRVQMKVEGLLDFCNKRGFGLLLTDGKNTFDKLLKLKTNRKLEKEILSALKEGVVRKRQCNEILKKCGATRNELLKAILKNNLKYRSYPLKLQYGNNNEIFRQVFIEKKRYNDIVTGRYSTLFKNEKKDNI